MEQDNHGNKSLFLYTALIFFVAIILIILAFFGQTKVQKSQPPISSEAPVQTAASIPEKTAVVSEENAKLMQEVNELSAQLEQKEEELMNDKLLLEAYAARVNGDEELLASALGSINYDRLTDEQKSAYDTIQQ